MAGNVDGFPVRHLLIDKPVMVPNKSLPLFPLDLVLYPGERLPLHIFEERYKDLTHYCLNHDMPFGILRQVDDTMAEVGTAARICEVVTRYDDGRLDIVASGEQRFRLGTLYDDESYYTADVSLIDDESGPVDRDARERVITQHIKLLELAGRTVRPELYDRVDFLSFTLAQNAALDDSQKQELLERESEAERIHYLVEHFETILPRLEDENDRRRRIRSNGHFKDFPPEEV